MTTRTLLLLRHASAEAAPGRPDAERPLSPAGVAEARRVGREIAATPPQHVLCSPALRTRQTWQHVSAELDTAPGVSFAPEIYGAEADELRELVWQTGDEVRTLLLVGHNPAVHRLAWTLLGDAAPHAFPPASLAVVTFTGQWTSL